MYDLSDSQRTIIIPSGLEMEKLNQNVTILVTEIEQTIVMEDPIEAEKLLTEAWIGIVLTLLVVTCACSMCGFLVYSRIQIWKRRVRRTRDIENVQSDEGRPYSDPLPSYTIVSGLPSYKEALEQLRVGKGKENTKSDEKGNLDWSPHTPPTPISKLSVMDLFQKYKNNNSND